MPFNANRKNAFGQAARMQPREQHNFFHAVKNNYVRDIKTYIDTYASAVSERQFTRTALQEAVARGHYAAMMCLLEAGADPNAFSDNGKNGVLFEAARIDRADLLGMLLHKGGQAWQTLADGTTLMMHAAQHDSPRIIAVLFARGHVGSAFNANGDACLHIAAKNGSAKAIGALIAGGEGVNKKNKAGDTPLMTALRAQKKDAVKALLELNADLRLMDDNGQTVQEIVKTLKDDGHAAFYADVMALFHAREANDAARFQAPFHDGTSAPITVKKPFTFKKGR